VKGFLLNYFNLFNIILKSGFFQIK